MRFEEEIKKLFDKYRASRSPRYTITLLEKDVVAVHRQQTQFLSEKGLLECIASLEHRQWAHITDYIIHNAHSNETLLRWEKLIDIPYGRLTEKEKESDREWARKVLSILKVQLILEKQQWQEKLVELLKNRPKCETCEIFLKTKTHPHRALICETGRALGNCPKDRWFEELGGLLKK